MFLETVSLNLSHQLVIVFLTVIIPIEFITRLRLFQSHLPEDKFRHSFQGLLNPISYQGLDSESFLGRLLHYARYNMERHTLLSTLKNIDNELLDLTKQVLTKILLFGSNSCDINTNTNFLNVTVSLVYLLKDLTNSFSMKLLIVVKTKLLIQN